MASLLWLPVIGWLVSPIISFFVNKLLSDLNFHLSRKLRELELQIIPSLEQILRDVTEQRMLRGAKNEGKGSESHLQALSELAKDVKSALYDADDVLDLIEYHRIKKKVIRDGKSLSTSISGWVSRCKQSGFGQKLWQCTQNQNQKLSDVGAKVQQYAQSLPLYIHQGAAGQPSATPDAPAAEFRGDMEQGTDMPSPTPDAPSTSNPPTPNALPNSAGSATEFNADNHHGSAEEAPSMSLVLMICDWLVCGVSALRSFYLAARHLRDWSYEPVGIKNGDGTATDFVLSINEIISLRKRIKNIEYSVSESKKSPLLNQSSSSTSKDADKESSSSTCTVKNSAEESSSEQKEIDKLYRSIEQKVFGRDKDREDISRMLREGQDTDTYAASSSTSKPYSVIGIYGITGSGKSTLAQYVCDYENGARHFDPIVFISVGKRFRLRDIFRDMLEQIKQSQSSNDEDLKSLKTELWKTLKDKRFLLVLDDLWVNDDNEKQRDILLDTLSAARSGSRILATAQKKDAAEALGAQEQFPIRDLEEEIYLSLFMHHARPVAANDYGEYERIGRKIANRLCRSPIAAVTVGKQLQRNKSISFWETTANLDVLDRTMGALWWSYQQLGVDIRRCFAYCSIFPRGYVLERNELVRIWIAQGFVSNRCNATEELEDIGQSYFDQLLTFSFLQVQKTNSIIRPEAVVIHDLLRKLTERVSRSEFFRISFHGSTEDIPPGVGHLFIETNNVAQMIEKTLVFRNLRTLIIKESYENIEEIMIKNHDLEKILDRLFRRLTKLRVLIMELHGYKEKLSVPASIYHMQHLRYVGFHFCVFALILPSTFSKLYHIQIMDTPCFQVTCPQDMGNLIYLRRIVAQIIYFPNTGRLVIQTPENFRKGGTRVWVEAADASE